ncbi:hypothetical protein H9W90_06785 [Polaribacter pectinis]|uniref:HTH luxR-type domain-containing protein n=1 Tax=Polaribacter pectinis TaxID=2738844 RepID=A0A7G9LDW1_9FLAO|nr:7TM diverse intracellular signaling domain-containing protein [Polaribacter pectinis]QNM86810.1 hypothetical protein H9W90_06785 [Polaribacter pectinis]
MNSGTYWFKVEVNKNKENLVAFLPTHNINRIDIYKSNNNQLKYVTSTGNSILLNEIPVDYKFPAFKISSNNTKKTTFYLKVDFPREANFPLKIKTEKDFVSFTIKKIKINSFYYGSCIVIILLNLFLYFKFKNNTYLFYLLFVASLMCLFLLLDGSFIDIFRGNNFYYKLEYLILIPCEIWFALFSIKFLNIHKRYPKYYKLLLILPSLTIVLFFLSIVTNNYLIAVFSITISVMLILPLFWFYALFKIKEMPYAKFYVVGFLIFVPFSIYFMFGLPCGLWQVNGEMLTLKISSWLDMFVFTYSIILMMQHKREENEREILNLQENLQKLSIDSSIKKQTLLEDSYLILLKENVLGIEPLTLRELDVLKALSKNLNNTEISNKLFISKNTVKYHIRNIYAKANVKTRTELKTKLSTSA